MNTKYETLKYLNEISNEIIRDIDEDERFSIHIFIGKDGTKRCDIYRNF